MATRKTQKVVVPDQKVTKQVNKIAREFPLCLRKFYKLNDAVKFASLKIPSITIEDLLHYAVLGKIQLLIHAPVWCIPELVEKTFPTKISISMFSQIPYIFGASMYATPSNILLELSTDDCMEIEIHGKVEQSIFENAYHFHNCEYVKIDKRSMDLEWKIKDRNEPKNYSSIIHSEKYLSAQNDKSIMSNYNNYQVERDKKVRDSILITMDGIIILDSELSILIKDFVFLQRQNEAKNKPQRLLPNYNSATDKHISHFRSLASLAKDTNDVNPLQLLRRAIQRNVTLYAIVPEGVYVCASFDISAPQFEYMWKPQILSLAKIECDDIFYRGQAKVYRFSHGYLVDDFGMLKRITPYDEQPNLPSNMVWRTRKNDQDYALQLNCHDLVAMSSDVRRLTSDVLHPDDFTFSYEINQEISSGRVLSIEDSVEIIKSKFVDCTPNNIVYAIYLESRKLLLFPLPIELTAKISGSEQLDSFGIPPLTAIFLILDHETIALMAMDCYAKTSRFSDLFLMPKNSFTRDLSNRRSILTFDGNLKYEIEINLKDIYITRDSLNIFLGKTKDQWNKLIEEIKKSKANIFEVHESKEMLHKNIASTLINNKVTDTFEVSEELISAIEVQEKLSIGRSTLCNLNNINSEYYNKEFPKPISEKGKKRFWKSSEIDDYIEKKSKRRGGSEGAPTDDRHQGSI